MSSLRGEFNVVRLPGMTEDDAVKTTVIFKFGKHSEPKALRVHLSDRGEVIGWPSYSHRRTRFHCDLQRIGYGLTKDHQIINHSSRSESILVICGLGKALRVRAIWCRQDKRSR